MIVNADYPKAFGPLFETQNRRRYYVMWGGRGSAKSWTVARALILACMREPLRILCAREIMKTISDSVHRLLSDQIAAMGLDAFFEIQETTIRHVDGAEFLFAGLRAIDAAKIKSFEGVDVCWVEEAQAVTKKSWGVLVPTIRAEDSEIWVTFNPELDTDDTYQRFVVNPPQNSWVKKVSWRDNPWFPSVLDEERRNLERSDPDEYRNVWEGECRTVLAGAIYAREVMEMIEAGRVCRCPYNPMLPVHTVWDLGWNDQTSIILLQKTHAEVSVIEYMEDSFVTVPEWVARLKERRYVWGTDYLPHDGAQTSRQTGKTDKAVLDGLGRKTKVLPRGDVETGIRAARRLFPRLYVDVEKGARLMECLKKYRRSIPQTTGEPGSPVHDEYSHGADAFRGLGMIVDQIRNESDMPKINVPVRRIQNPRVGY